MTNKSHILVIDEDANVNAETVNKSTGDAVGELWDEYPMTGVIAVAVNMNLIMDRVVKRATELMDAHYQEPDPHWTICRIVADEFRLFDNEAMFPVWLSRVVEGVMNDWRADRDPG